VSANLKLVLRLLASGVAIIGAHDAGEVRNDWVSVLGVLLVLGWFLCVDRLIRREQE